MLSWVIINIYWIRGINYIVLTRVINNLLIRWQIIIKKRIHTHLCLDIKNKSTIAMIIKIMMLIINN
jgi:hypothetical protein